MGFAAVILLGWMARYYTRVLEREKPGVVTHAPATEHTSPGFDATDLQAFIDVRRLLKQQAGDWPPDDPAQRDDALHALRRFRDALFAEGKMRSEVYFEVREVYRVWRQGGPGIESSRERLLESRRRELQSVDLGSLEPYDL